MSSSGYENVQSYQIRPSINSNQQPLSNIPYSSYAQGGDISKYYQNSGVAPAMNVPTPSAINQQTQYYSSNNGQGISSLTPSPTLNCDRTNINVGSKLFVGQVPAVCTEEQLIPIFSPYGNLLEVKIMRAPNGGSKGSAWVRYETHEMASAAIEALHERRVIPPQTNPLRVQFAENKMQQRASQDQTRLHQPSYQQPPHIYSATAQQYTGYPPQPQPQPQHQGMAQYSASAPGGNYGATMSYFTYQNAPRMAPTAAYGYGPAAATTASLYTMMPDANASSGQWTQ